jgi:ATP-dependent RNA helicase DDX46/PRP5
LDDEIINYFTIKLNLENLTPIQSYCVPFGLSGRDIISIARTGSGKTIGYLIPVIKHVFE